MALGPQFTQLQMFMTGTELRNSVTESRDRLVDLPQRESLSAMWDRKAQESRAPRSAGTDGAGTHDWVNSGYRGGSAISMVHRTQPGLDPIHGEHHTILDGQHRVAAAASIESQTGKKIYFPVMHYDSTTPLPKAPGGGTPTPGSLL